MKTRLVVWGTDANDERILVAIALVARENKVDIWTFPEQVATEALYNRLMNEWRVGRDVPFPNVFIQIERPLSATEPLLPEDIKIERTDLIQRAQSEWHFVVLSAKMYEAYYEELEHIAGKAENLDAFDTQIWEELKGFWEKVQSQIHDKNLFRDHARKLKDKTNALFSKLKELRRSMDDELRSKSKEKAAEFFDKLDDIEERIEKGLGLQPLFEELKILQRKYRETRFAREDRNKLWQRIDKAFKDIKQKRYGPGYKKDYSPIERIKRRYDGLIAAIGKMERSIDRDKQDVEFQDKKIEESDGQLEAQIRQAKLNMIRERITSKERKLQEMLKTKVELEDRLRTEEQKQEQREEGEKIAEAGEQVKEKIAEEIKEDRSAREEIAEDLEKAADAIADAEKKIKDVDEDIVSAVSTAVGETLEDVIDTVKAVAEVVSDKIEEAFGEEE